MNTPLINGVNYSWANVKLVLFGVPVLGITKIEYSSKQKKENNFGMGTIAVSRGYGNKEFEGKITLYRDEWNAIIAAAPNRDPNDIEPFDIQVSFSGARVATTTDVLQACEFTEDPFTVSQGDTKIMVEIPLVIGLISHR
jgi:hypothetical protein